MVLNHITAGEVPPLMNKIASHCNIRTTPPNKKITSVTNRFNQGKAPVLFIAVPDVSSELFLPLIHKCEPEIFRSKWKKECTLKFRERKELSLAIQQFRDGIRRPEQRMYAQVTISKDIEVQSEVWLGCILLSLLLLIFIVDDPCWSTRRT